METALVTLPFIACSAANMTGPNVAPVSGTYILERVDGVPLPTSIASTGGCPRAITRGVLRFDPRYGDSPPLYGWDITVAATCDPSRPQIAPVAADSGTWDVEGGDRLTFSSRAGGGSYGGAIGTRDSAVVATFARAGRTYTFRLVRGWNAPVGALSVAVVDEAGAPVAGAVLELRAPDGVGAGGTSRSDQAFSTVGAPGLWTVAVFAPSGYTTAPNRPNPFTALVAANATTTERVVLTKAGA